jgi:hypothetical protein
MRSRTGIDTYQGIEVNTQSVQCTQTRINIAWGI